MISGRRVALDALLMTGGRIGFVALWFVGVALVYRGLGADADGVAPAGLFAMCIAVIKVVSGCCCIAPRRRGYWVWSRWRSWETLCCAPR